MTLNEYQELAARTMKPRRDLTDDLSDYILGLAGEAGELANTAKKMLYHGHDWDKQKLLEEATDVMWYVAAVATVLGASLGEVAKQNIEKLRKRYPEGYSDEKSRNREGEV